MFVSLANLIALCNHGKLHSIRDPATDHVVSLGSSIAGLVDNRDTLSCLLL
jgi:hypothetical protein